MLLVKCKCGCFFTLKDAKKSPLMKCPNCDVVLDIEAGAESNCSVNHIPDDSKISVRFDV